MIYTYRDVPKDVQEDIDYIYLEVINRGGKRVYNYLPEKLEEPVLATTIRYDSTGRPVSTARILVRDIYDSAVRVLDRYALIENQNGLLPSNYDGKFKPETSAMLEQQTDFCVKEGFDCIFFSLNKKASRVITRVVEGHNKYSKYEWKIDGPMYVTNKPSDEGYQMIGYTGEPFRRKDGIHHTDLG